MNDRELLESLVDTLADVMSRYDEVGDIMKAVDRSGFDVLHAISEATALLECLP